MIKLYNSSPFEDATLKGILTFAAKTVGCRISRGVVVKVTRGGLRTTSYASGCAFVKRWFLVRKGGKRWIETDKGYIVLRPSHCHCGDHVWAARNFYRVACHEFGHVRDWQKHEPFDSKRLAWHHRCQEVRAQEYENAALEKLDAGKVPDALQDLLVELAIQWEAYDKRKRR